MQCDMCGQEAQLFPTEIEGTVLQVCKRCSRYGAIQKAPKPVKPKVKRKPKEEPEYLIVPDYASQIRAVREKSGLTQEQFAKRINEKVSLIHNLERGKMKPPLKLARKLEKTFSLKLVEEDSQEKGESFKTSHSDGLTLGDLLKGKE
ncbi:MAG: multiprotein bridging factor aMBF1 [Nanobdellota archaeon]